MKVLHIMRVNKILVKDKGEGEGWNWVESVLHNPTEITSLIEAKVKNLPLQKLSSLP